ncbi:hypothetical protein [Marinoscillum luteum]|uniref:DUF4190 domain-containing protein n=1 Tax=Marinoscillum luteum TaxID=861051 RepID=A0ABW7NAH8_9BACT
MPDGTQVILAVIVMIAFGVSLAGLFAFRGDIKGSKRTIALIGNILTVAFFVFMVVWSLSPTFESNIKEAEIQSIEEKTALGYIHDFQSKNVRIFENSVGETKQINLEITDSEIMSNYLSRMDTTPVDSVYLFSMNMASKLHQQLRKDYSYDNIHLSFLSNDEQVYYFDFCLNNCD